MQQKPDTEEKNIAQWQALLTQGDISAVELTEHFLSRIAAFDGAGPALNSVLETNPDALEIAATLDDERAQGRLRGPLHGIPILIKDTFDTADGMMTTAGSLALGGNYAPKDAFVVSKLRGAGAVLLGKTNLSEWSSFRSRRGCQGWSSRGGQTRNPYALDRTPHGSSSGSGVAVAANLCAAALGTETDGSVVYPASATGIVGLKPTVGLLSRSGIVPISHSQDTAGPMARTVADAATLLSALTGFDKDDPTMRADTKAKDYRTFLNSEGLKGSRLGVARGYFGYHEKADAVAEDALDVLRDLGAVLVDVDFALSANGLSVECELEVLLYEFKAGLNRYLAQHPNAKVRNLEDVIAFNKTHAERVMPYFQQDLLEQAQTKGDLNEPVYSAALAECRRLSRKGIDKALRDHRLDALVAPTQGPAWVIDPVVGDNFRGGCALPAALAGYPHITVPMGYTHGLPLGLSFFGGAFSEGNLIGYAYAFEQATQVRRAPTLQVVLP